jgi:hypothetical protein
MSAIILYTGVTSVGFIYFSTNILEDMIRNWQVHPIEDIREGKITCPAAYEPLVLDYWPGTVTGCDCTWDIIPTIYRRKCDKDDSIFCSTITSRPEISMNLWNGVLLCVKRYPENYLFFLSQRVTNTDCPNGMKFCGRLDGTNKNYCVNWDRSCFINDISISSTIDINSIALGYGKYLTFSKSQTNPNKQIISEFTTSQGDVCLDPKQKNRKEKVYKLTNYDKYTYYCTHSLNNEFYDKRYELIDTCPLADYYSYNGLEPVFKTLPLYPMPSNIDNISLHARGFVQWKENCRYDEHLSPENVVLTYEKLKQVVDGQYFIYIFSIIYLPVVILLIFVKLIFVTFKDDDEVAATALKVTDGINFLFVFMGMLFSISTYWTGSYLVNFFLALKDSNCGDEITNIAMYNLGEKLHSNIYKNQISMILYVLTFIIIPLNIIIMHLRSPKSDFVEQDPNNYTRIPE